MSDDTQRKRIIRLPTPRQQAQYETRKAMLNAMLLECKDG